MSNILLLVHRLPYPPNKGDKVRSYNLLRHLAERHKVYLGTFVDDPEDKKHIDTVRSLCEEIYVAELSPFFAKLRSLNGFVSNEALTLCYYRDSGMKDWVNTTCANQRINASVVFSSAMAQYVEDHSRLLMLIDFVDVDSAKWTQYAKTSRGLKAWVYRREGKRLLAYERMAAQRAARSFFVTEAETELFRTLAPECAMRLECICNGVDSEFFKSVDGVFNPYGQDEISVVFTGAMDYFPNIDAVKWFADTVMPRIEARWSNVRFYIVGRSPSPDVQKLAGPRITVTGTVPDVRPFIQHAAIVVAPLRIARGVQNKILEAMAMARPVIASRACASGIDAVDGEHFLIAESVEDFVHAIDSLLASPSKGNALGLAARQRVLARYSWKASLSGIDPYLGSASHLGSSSPADSE
jgi:polysaccharide biosynthesis protein PslH